ncbi:MAG: hypothetical protein DMD71_00630, partial [Gemmatimonadetes bacterium]
YPRRIAVITSPDGAALKDIIAVVGRRWPIAEVIVLPAQVQGAGAEDELCAALASLRRLAVDVAIVGRGGGSKEDLWTFNRERVARAVAASAVPVISAVGHETDVTLCDLVADWRAATPSAAAEAATPDQADVRAALEQLGGRLARGLTTRAQRAGDLLARSQDRLVGRRVEPAQDPRSGLRRGPRRPWRRAAARRAVRSRAGLPLARERRRGAGAHGAVVTPPPPVAPDPQDLAAQLERLEQIVRRLEAPELDLDEALKLFEEGVERLRAARERLAQAELKVKKVLEHLDR